VRTGPVGVVTQSGGTGSYLHNLAAARGGGLAATISTGNEADVGVGDAIAALVGCEEVRAVAVVLETVRDGRAFMDAVREARRAGKPVVACRLGTSRHGQELMRSHTGALALPARVIEGVCDALGVTLARTPAELLDVAEVMARARTPAGGRVGVVTHSGGTAILLSDLAAESAVQLPRPPEALVEGLRPLLSHGSPANPVDLGAIIGGPHRFGEVVGQFLGSGAYDTVLAVSTPHPPAHSVGRARQLAELDHGDPTLVHLWMAGDLGAPGLEALRRCGAAVTEEPRAAIRAVAGLARLAELRADEPAVPGPTPAPEAAGGAPREVPREPATAGTLSEQGSKTLLAGWGLPVVEGDLATTSGEAVEIAARIGYPVVVKASAPELAHKSDVGGVRLDLSTPGQVREAFEDVLAAAGRGSPGVPVEGARVERYRPGPEVILGCVIDADFGPTTLVGIGGMDAELLELVSVAPAPLSPAGARRVLARMPGRALLGAARRDGQRPDVEALADLVSQVSIRFCEARGRFAELEMNPLTWSGGAWRVVDALVRLAGAGP
ncbi:MAG: acetate--CoA ligase family protein, partial [Acidimicrobiales bacterium]